MGGQRVFAVRRCLTFAEPHMIRNNRPMSRRDRRDEAAVNVAPGWLPMQHDHRAAAALVDIMLLKARRRAKPWRVRPCAVKRLVRRDHDASVCLAARQATSFGTIFRSLFS